MDSNNLENQTNNYTPGEEPKNNKKLIIVFVVAILVIILVIIGYFGYRLYFDAKMSGPLPEEESKVDAGEGLGEDQDQKEDADQDQGQEDTDQKPTTYVPGLDSDGDGLTDRQEEVTWKTDPNNPDTDGDGYSDYDEIQRGYNPLGEGKFPTAQDMIEKWKKSGAK